MIFLTIISQTPKHVQDMSNFNMTSNPHGYLALFVPKTPLVVWYFIIDLIPSKVHSYLALFESKSTDLQTLQIYSDFTQSFLLSKSELLFSISLLKLT